jgi:hypothetical protein
LRPGVFAQQIIELLAQFQGQISGKLLIICDGMPATAARTAYIKVTPGDDDEIQFSC